MGTNAFVLKGWARMGRGAFIGQPFSLTSAWTRSSRGVQRSFFLSHMLLPDLNTVQGAYITCMITNEQEGCFHF